MNSKEKIRQFVIMARHPEAGSYKEALEMESKFDDCLYECQMLEYGKNNDIHYTKMTKLEYFKKSLEIHNIHLDIDNLNFSILATQKHRLVNLKIIQILGRPITAFDVCWALNKKHNPNHTYYFDLKLYNIHNTSHHSMIISVSGKGDKDKAGIIYFTAKKSDGSDIFLTEWEDDVCDRIAELTEL